MSTSSWKTSLRALRDLFLARASSRSTSAPHARGLKWRSRAVSERFFNAALLRASAPAS
eukprot:CAMPEP_0175319704 /NCGR_PEP_ID=MMETSP0093-20121207/71077_1 /TAXON_ID=311494 /ORGANISM="Alexandrium monilatum, Strain CCMP3105" /LENGTH=58 /DNA_ID=CAMNT_0016616531 /DNA_START=28 /DNA_END=201 /DNA_ORIENTATION=-